MKKTVEDDLDKCTLCGGCKAVCPTYDEGLTEGMGARGRLKLINGLISGELKPSPLLSELLFSCILCGACSGSCPLGVDIPDAVYKGRALLRSSDKKRRFLRYLFTFASKWPDTAFKLLLTGQDFLLPLLAKRGFIPFYAELTDTPLRAIEQVYKVPKKKGRVAVFTGCSVNYLYPHLGESLINVLRQIGYEVVLPKGEVCCGAPLRALGMADEAAELAISNYRIFSGLRVDAVLSLCPTCTLTIRHEYLNIIGKGIDNAQDISEFFHDKLTLKDPFLARAVYHDPCHLKHGLGIKKEPREIISKAGIELLEAEEQSCCGFGGTFCMSYKNISKKLLNTCAASLLNTKAETVVTSCPGCMMYLGQAITDRPVLHLIELMEEAYCHRKPKHEHTASVKA